MGFDINTVAKDMLSAAEGVFRDEWPKVKEVMEQVLADEQDALEKIARAYISGAINEEEFRDQLESERDAFAAGEAMVKVCSKVTIQKAVNAALQALMEAAKAAV